MKESQKEQCLPTGALLLDSFTAPGPTTSAYSLIERVQDPEENMAQKNGGKNSFGINGDDKEDEYGFYWLAHNHFRNLDPPPQFCRKEPRQPLLRDTPDSDKELLCKVWKILLRFTGDLPDYRHNIATNHQPNMGSVMSRIYCDLGLIPTDPDLRPQASTTSSRVNGDVAMKSLPTKPRGSTFRRLKATLTQRLMKGRSRKTVFHALPLEETLRTTLEQIHYIIGYCILKPTVRDEVYCFSCKQLVNNPVKASAARGWVLLSLLVGCCLPSPQLVPYLQHVISQGPPIHTSTTLKLLQRSLQNGTRCQPPAHIEIESCLDKKPLEIQVTFMDGTVQCLVVDPACTASEVVQRLAQQIRLKQTFGFSLYIAMFTKVASLNSIDHIMDSISQCEQIYRDQHDGIEANAPWRLFFRKEIFSAWDDYSSDPIATNLIFAQVTRGMMLGEYTTDSDQELAILAAQQYFIDYGGTISDDSLVSVLPSYIPQERRTEEDSNKYWRKLVMKAYNKMFLTKTGKRPTEHKVKTDLLYYAKRKWVDPFSKIHDVIKLEGPNWPTDDHVKLVINSGGVAILSEQGITLVRVKWEDISSIKAEGETSANQNSDSAVLIFILTNGCILKLGSMDAPCIRQTITYLMEGCRQRSLWAVAKESYNGSVEEVTMDEGDVIQLAHPAGQEALTTPKCQGTNTSTGQQGLIPSHLLYIPATLEKPSEKLQSLVRTPWACNSFTLNGDGILEMSLPDDNPIRPHEITYSCVRLADSLPGVTPTRPLSKSSTYKADDYGVDINQNHKLDMENEVTGEMDDSNKHENGATEKEADYTGSGAKSNDNDAHEYANEPYYETDAEIIPNGAEVVIHDSVDKDNHVGTEIKEVKEVTGDAYGVTGQTITDTQSDLDLNGHFEDTEKIEDYIGDIAEDNISAKQYETGTEFQKSNDGLPVLSKSPLEMSL